MTHQNGTALPEKQLLLFDRETVYEGQTHHGIPHGRGAVFFASGNIFVGQFANGQIEGNGCFFFSTGQYFIGRITALDTWEGVFGIDGKEVEGEWRGTRCVSSTPLSTPSVLQQGHASLFATVLDHVHDHFFLFSSVNPLTLVADGTLTVATTRAPLDLQLPTMALLISRQQLESHEPVKASSHNGMQLHSVASREQLVTQPAMSSPASPYMPLPARRRLSSSSSARSIGVDVKAVVDPQALTGHNVFWNAAPAAVEFFSFTKLCQRAFVFLFPFLSLPGIPFAPLKVTSLEIEREFVVSGATLLRDFDPPTFSLWIIALAVCCQIAAIVIVACKVTLGTVQEGRLTLPEMVIPCILWVVVGFTCAGYDAYNRVPHSLECMDRQLTPALCAYAASTVDSRSRVCITTWNEEGRGKVKNNHYRYRWLLFSVVLAAMMCLSAPSTRGGFGHGMFGKKGFEMAAALLAFFSTFFFTVVLVYYVVKITDMQREVCAKLQAITNVAFLEKRSIARPSLHLSQPFELSEVVNTCEMFRGFSGWYVARSLILYASASANHLSRGAAMSVFTFALFCTSLVSISDVFYMLANGYGRSQNYYSTAHAYGFFVQLFLALLLARYLYACSSTSRQFSRHLFIMDVATLYHDVKRQDRDGAELIHMSRSIAAEHDVRPHLFGCCLQNWVVLVLIVFNLAGLTANVFQLGEVIYY